MPRDFSIQRKLQSPILIWVTLDLADRISHLHRQSESISEGANLMTRQTQLAAVTSDQMMRTVDEIGRGVARVVESSARSSQSVNQGDVIVKQRFERMQQLQKRAAGIAGEMERLNQVSAEEIKALSERTTEENRKTFVVIQNFQKQADAFHLEIKDMMVFSNPFPRSRSSTNT